MNFNLFSVIAASAISATVVLPASASVEITSKKSHTQSYTQKYLQQSANFYAALDHKARLDAVEGEVVVELLVRERDEVFDRLWRFLREEANLDGALAGLDNRDWRLRRSGGLALWLASRCCRCLCEERCGCKRHRGPDQCASQ